MSKRRKLLVPLLASCVFLVEGALNRQVLLSRPLVRLDRVSQNTPADSSFQKSDRDVKQLFDRVLGEFYPDKLTWLRYTLDQQTTTVDGVTHLSSRLLLGPRNCARRETSLEIDGALGTHLVVSDGVALAESRQTREAPAEISSMPLPGAASPRETAQILEAKGCAGPYCLLVMLQELFKDKQSSVQVVAETGIYDGRQTIRLSRALSDTDNPLLASLHLPGKACRCRLYLDASSSWPCRLEWWNEYGLAVTMEWRGLALNQPMSDEECAQAFSFVAPLNSTQN